MTAEWIELTHENHPREQIIVAYNSDGYFPPKTAFWQSGKGFCDLFGNPLGWHPTHFILLPEAPSRTISMKHDHESKSESGRIRYIGSDITCKTCKFNIGNKKCKKLTGDHEIGCGLYEDA